MLCAHNISKFTIIIKYWKTTILCFCNKGLFQVMWIYFEFIYVLKVYFRSRWSYEEIFLILNWYSQSKHSKWIKIFKQLSLKIDFKQLKVPVQTVLKNMRSTSFYLHQCIEKKEMYCVCLWESHPKHANHKLQQQVALRHVLKDARPHPTARCKRPPKRADF